MSGTSDLGGLWGNYMVKVWYWEYPNLEVYGKVICESGQKYSTNRLSSPAVKVWCWEQTQLWALWESYLWKWSKVLCTNRLGSLAVKVSIFQVVLLSPFKLFRYILVLFAHIYKRDTSGIVVLNTLKLLSKTFC